MSLQNNCCASLIAFCCAFVLSVNFEAQAKGEGDRPIADKWALIIGIDKFSDRRIPTLKYSAKDAKDFASFLVKEGNFGNDHVLTLFSDNSIFENIEVVD